MTEFRVFSGFPNNQFVRKFMFMVRRFMNYRSVTEKIIKWSPDYIVNNSEAAFHNFFECLTFLLMSCSLNFLVIFSVFDVTSLEICVSCYLCYLISGNWIAAR